MRPAADRARVDSHARVDSRARAPDRASAATPGLRLTVVGCAAAWSTRPGRASSCYLVEIGDDALVLDMGQGSFSQLAARRDPATLRGVLISHAHADHCVDLVPFRHYVKHGRPGRPLAAPAVHGPVDLPSRFDDFAREPHLLAPFAFHALITGSLRIGPFDVKVERVAHVDRSFAFRVARARRTGERPGPPGLVYSGDCGDPSDLVPLIRPGDTLLAEAYWGAGPGDPAANHLDAAGAARAAREGAAARLILTHLRDGVDPAAARRAARAVFEGEVLVARPGLVVEIGQPG